MFMNQVCTQDCTVSCMRDDLVGADTRCTSVRISVQIPRTHIKAGCVARMSDLCTPVGRWEMEKRIPGSLWVRQPGTCNGKAKAHCSERGCPLMSTYGGMFIRIHTHRVLTEIYSVVSIRLACIIFRVLK